MTINRQRRLDLHAEARRLEAQGRLDAAIACYRAGLAAPAPDDFPALDRASTDPARAAAARFLHRPEPAAAAPAISVIIPCFKAGATLARALGSILDQPAPPLEIILVDDASPDATLQTALALAAAHPEIAVVARSRNGGPGAARNDGIRASRGRFLSFLDADDEYAPGFFAAALAPLAADRAVSATRTGIALTGLDQAIDPLRHEAVVNSMITNLLVRREVVEIAGGFPESPIFRGERGGEDVAFGKILAKYFGVARDPRPLMIHHVHGESHLGRFLRDSRVIDGRIVKPHFTAEEESGLLPLAGLMHERAFQDRLESRGA